MLALVMANWTMELELNSLGNGKAYRIQQEESQEQCPGCHGAAYRCHGVAPSCVLVYFLFKFLWPCLAKCSFPLCPGTSVSASAE